MRPRAGNGPRNMTVKLLGCDDETVTPGARVPIPVDQVVITLPTTVGFDEALAGIERAPRLDLAVAYETHCIRDRGDERDESLLGQHLRRLGIARGRRGIGYPAAVHLERCAAPGRVLVTDSPPIGMVGGLGMLALTLRPNQIIDVISKGQFDWQVPEVIQVILSGRLSASVSARDVTLELVRLGLAERVRATALGAESPVVLEFSGPGTRSMSVSERALLCSIARDVGASAALATCDEKTELFLRAQRRSKAYRHLAPDAGAPCAEVLCLDLSTVLPLIRLASGVIAPVADVANSPIQEVVIAGETSASLRELLAAAAWFKTKRISSDVDVLIVPATRQALESIAANGTLSQLLAVGARLVEPDVRLLNGQWHPPKSEGTSLRSFVPDARQPGFCLASLDTLCTSAIAGSIQDPRAARRALRVALPRELPIDDSLLFDKKPSTLATTPPPRARSDERQSGLGQPSRWSEVAHLADVGGGDVPE
jgi:aconitate hydratase